MGTATVQQARQKTLNRAYASKSVRFSNGTPKVLPLHEQVYITRIEPPTTEGEFEEQIKDFNFCLKRIDTFRYAKAGIYTQYFS